MQIEPTIQSISEKKFVGMSEEMSLADNKTFKLFSAFMPNKKIITNAIGNDVFDIQTYSPDYHKNFSPTNSFTKWALVEVTDFDAIPDGMDRFVLNAGDYAVFTKKGIEVDPRIFSYIFMDWLPKSNYLLDDRPHFDILSEKYQRKDPEAEQSFWIPVKPKN